MKTFILTILVLGQLVSQAIAAPEILPEAKFGTGLNAISDWSTELPFIDLMKRKRESRL